MKYCDEVVATDDEDEQQVADDDGELEAAPDDDEEHTAALQQTDGGIITPLSLSPEAEVHQTPETDASLDWDNYASDPSFVSPSPRSAIRNNRSSTRDDLVDMLNISSSSAESVFPVDEPPPLPPRARSSTSVIQCSSQTCKPDNLRPPQ